MIVTIRANGVPQPQGSIAYKGLRGGKPIMVSDNERPLHVWRAIVAASVHEAVGPGWTPLDEPVQVYARVWVPRPKRPMFQQPATRPDADKYARAILDGLGDGGLYVDDGRVIDQAVGKRFADAEHEAGARVLIVWGDDLVLD